METPLFPWAGSVVIDEIRCLLVSPVTLTEVTEIFSPSIRRMARTRQGTGQAAGKASWGQRSRSQKGTRRRGSGGGGVLARRGRVSSQQQEEQWTFVFREKGRKLDSEEEEKEEADTWSRGTGSDWRGQVCPLCSASKWPSINNFKCTLFFVSLLAFLLVFCIFSSFMALGFRSFNFLNVHFVRQTKIGSSSS